MNKLVCYLMFLVCGSAYADIPVLMYHMVDSQTAPGSTVTSREMFFAQMTFLKQQGYTTLTIHELTDIMNGKHKAPKKAVAITFDDGWKSVMYAAEVLHVSDMSATFFIISSTFTDPLYLTPDEIRTLSDNKRFEIGAHTHTHFVKHADHINEVDTSMLVGEAMMSKLLIEQVINKNVTSIAWPYGYATDDAIKFVTKLGYTSTSLVTNGANVVGDTPSKIKRLNVDGRCDIKAFQTMLETYVTPVCK